MSMITMSEDEAGEVLTLRMQRQRNALYAVAVGQVEHLYMGDCPDRLDGSHLRDPDCPACAVLDPTPETQPEKETR